MTAPTKAQLSHPSACSRSGRLFTCWQHCLPCCRAPLGQELKVLMPFPCQHHLWPQTESLAWPSFPTPRYLQWGMAGEKIRDRIKNTKAYWKAAAEVVEPKQPFAAAAASAEGPGAGTATRGTWLQPHHLAGTRSIHTSHGKRRGGRRELGGGCR